MSITRVPPPAFGISMHPGHTQAILAEAQRMQARVASQMAIGLFLLPGRMEPCVTPRLKAALSWSQPDFP